MTVMMMILNATLLKSGIKEEKKKNATPKMESVRSKRDKTSEVLFLFMGNTRVTLN